MAFLTIDYQKTALEVATELKKHDLNVIPVKWGDKKPIPKGWTQFQTKKMEEYEFQKLFKNKCNVGVVCGLLSGNLVVIDADNPILAKKFDEKLPSTFTILTGSGKGNKQFYFRVSDEELPDSQAFDYKNAQNEISHFEYRAEGNQCVIWGQHPSGNYYQIEKNVPIACVTWIEIIEIVNSVLFDMQLTKISKRKAKKKENQKTTYTIVNSEDQTVIGLLPPLEVMVGFSGLGPHPIHGSTNGKNLHVDTQKQLWCCFRCDKNGGGKFEWYAVQKGIIQCDEASSMSKEQRRATFEAIKKEYNYIPQKKTSLSKAIPIPQENLTEASEIVKNPNLLQLMCDIESKIIPGNNIAKKIGIISIIGVIHGREVKLHYTGDKGSGKTTFCSEMASLSILFFVFDDISPKSFYYMCKDNPKALDKAIIVLDDVPANLPDEKLAVYKALMSDSTSKDRVISTVISQQQVTLKIEGKFTVWSNGTQLPGDDQLQDRVTVVPIKTDSAYQKIVLDRIANRHISSVKEIHATNEVKNELRAIIKVISEESTKDTIIPFIAIIDKEKFLGHNRGFDQFLYWIECSALLHKFSRPRSSNNEIIATLDDLFIAWEIMTQLFTLNITEVKITETQRKILDVLPGSKDHDEWNDRKNAHYKVTSEPFFEDEPGLTIAELEKATQTARSTLERYLRVLKNESKEDRYREVPKLVESYGKRNAKRYVRLETQFKNSVQLGTPLVQNIVPEITEFLTSVCNKKDNIDIIKKIGQRVQEQDTHNSIDDESLKLSLLFSTIVSVTLSHMVKVCTEYQPSSPTPPIQSTEAKKSGSPFVPSCPSVPEYLNDTKNNLSVCDRDSIFKKIMTLLRHKGGKFSFNDAWNEYKHHGWITEEKLTTQLNEYMQEGHLCHGDDKHYDFLD